MPSKKCKHGKFSCKECRTSDYCEHDRIKSQCKDCGGSNICKHGRQRASCKDCHGSQICEHGLQKGNCVACHGKNICKHNKMKQKCKECNGSSICVHDRMRSVCKECHGGSICKHGNYRTRCKECHGSSICEHGIMKSTCRKCKGSRFCEHGKLKQNCKDCHGSNICEHNVFKAMCKKCHGSRICKHNNVKDRCKECHGVGICQHEKLKQVCSICNGCKHHKLKKFCRECGGNALCKSPWCETIATKKFKYYCLFCFVHLFPDEPIARNYRTKEKIIVDYVTSEFNEYTWITNKKVQDGCSKRRPDLLVDLGDQVVIIEIDENQHIDYDCSCENKRLMELSKDVGHRPIVFIRFNPDGYINNEGTKIKSCWTTNTKGFTIVRKIDEPKWNKRLTQLKEQIKYWCENKTDKTVEVIQICYDEK